MKVMGRVTHVRRTSTRRCQAAGRNASHANQIQWPRAKGRLHVMVSQIFHFFKSNISFFEING